jgi:DNA-binding NarL/FixJ family response regulator
MTGEGRGRADGAAGRRIRVVIADDHPVVRGGLRGMFAAQPDLEVVGEAENGIEAVELAERRRPDVVLMDLRMPRMDGVAATERIRARLPETRVVVLTTYDSDSDILRAVEAGATGYLLKDAPEEDLYGAVRAAAEGKPLLAPSVAALLMERTRRPLGENLSGREIEVLRLVAKGLSNREVASELWISEATVKSHLIRIFGKLGVDDRTAAVTAAFERGILKPGA